MADIPPAVLSDLNGGRIETVSLVEWLAIDASVLLESVAEEVGLGRHARDLRTHARSLASEGVSRRVRGMGAALSATIGPVRKGRKTFERLAHHRSDMVRAWACYWLGADREWSLKERLAEAKRFAADPAMSVRECAWDSFRDQLSKDLQRGIRLLVPWTKDADPAVRRCAIEATRPRGVWCTHLEPLKRDPSPGLVLLEPVRSDSSDYVRRSVGNWLNDASKTRPDWVRDVCRRWLAASPTPETAWIVRRGLRTLDKKAK